MCLRPWGEECILCESGAKRSHKIFAYLRFPCAKPKQTPRLASVGSQSANPKRGCLNVGAWNPQESGRKAPFSCNVAFSMLHCCFSLAAAQLLVKMTSALQKSQCCGVTSAAQHSENCSATSVFACGMLQGWGLEEWGLGFLDKERLMSVIFRPQFWGRKWSRQFYGRLGFFGSFCWKTPMPTKFWAFLEGGVEVPIEFFMGAMTPWRVVENVADEGGSPHGILWSFGVDRGHTKRIMQQHAS